MKLVDLFREFHADATRNNFSGSVRLLYFTILGEWNSRGRPDKFFMSSSVLQTNCGLPLRTYQRALRELNSRNFIQTAARRGKPLVVIWMMAVEMWQTRRNVGAAENLPVNRVRVKELPEKEKDVHARIQENPDEDRRTANSKFAGKTLAEILASKRAESAAGAKSNPSPEGETGGES